MTPEWLIGVFVVLAEAHYFKYNEKNPNKDRNDYIYFSMANFDTKLWKLPELHIYFDDKADWIEINDALPKRWD